jgi:hypothetical protein
LIKAFKKNTRKKYKKKLVLKNTNIEKKTNINDKLKGGL